MRRGEFQYTDAAGGVESACLLWFAAVRLGDRRLLKPAQALLRKKRQTKRSANWPGPIAHFLLGEMDQLRLLERVAKVPILRERQLCQGEFYVAVKAYEEGDISAYRCALKRASDLKIALLENEFYLANHEYDILTKEGGTI
jgi:hypothetical protein